MTTGRNDLENLGKFAHELADSAGKAILPYFRSTYELDDKAEDGFDPVTEADRLAETVMRDAITKRFPDDAILGEEFGSTPGTSGRTWVLDPIDGTRAFITGIPTWGTLIGLVENDVPLLGMMDQPFTNERYFSWSNKAWGQHKDERFTLKTSAKENLEHAFLSATGPEIFYTDDEQSAFKRLSTKTRLTRFGGDCYLYCQLAAGQIDLVVEANLNPYDILPLIPIIEAAGGVITDWQGKTVTGSGHVIAAANATLHASALDALKA